MNLSRNLRAVALALSVVVAGCQCGGAAPNLDAGSTGGGSGGATGGGTGGGGTTGGGSGGSTGGGVGGGGAAGDGGIVVDPNDLQNPLRDSDCDGLSDAEEYGNTYAGGKRTDPANPDTDGDGIKDGVEAGRTSSVNATCGFVGDVDPATRTLPTETDSDLDGVPDGIEDADHNGRAEASETDATNPDTDFDGLQDGAEDANHNGAVDSGETDPRKKDTDGDLINDGVELARTRTDPTKADTDGDTCADGAEDFNQNGIVDLGETNPKLATDCGPANNPDTDSDGLTNKQEDKNQNGMVDPGETDPTKADTDGDGLKDGLEDANKNGLVDPGETNPLRKDSDCDGLLDGPNAGTLKGEDLNANGTVDALETDPRNPDSDGDGITDGVERGVAAADRADTTTCMNVPFDADPTTTTDPGKKDSDGDGIDDGAEDINQNGKVDLGELDPKNGMDGTGPAGKVCTQMTLRPVLFKAETEPDLQLGLPATFTETGTMTVGGTKRGVIGYDPTHKVAFIAWKQAAPGTATTPAADEAALQATLSGVAPISNPTTQTFTTWDGLPALQAFYDQAGTTDVKTRAIAIAEAMVGTGAGAALPGTSGAVGPFQLQVEFIHRANAAVVVVVALTPKANFTGAPIFSMSDTAGGSAVAQFGDATAAQCELFSPSSGKVDFVFVVDDSCSMAASQTALASAADSMATALNNSTLDWRVALAGSSYGLPGRTNYTNIRRGFVAKNDANAIATFKGWLNKNAACTDGNNGQCNVGAACYPVDGGWVGICAGGQEAILGAARAFVNDVTPGTDAGLPAVAGRARQDAQLVVVLLGDADDQSTGYTTSVESCGSDAGQCESVNNFINFFKGTGAALADGGFAQTRNKTLANIPVHTIVCPDTGGACNSEYRTPGVQRHAQVTLATGAIRGAINNNTSIQTTMTNIVTSTIAAAGYKLQKPPIGASVKVAMNDVVNPTNCNKDDIPRSRIDGFDFDGINRSLSFFGQCRPSGAATQAAVSYKYWIDTTPNPTGNPPPCSQDTQFYDPLDPDFCKGKLTCNFTTNLCECPSNCGGNGPVGKVCNPNRFVCDFVCTSDCGGTCNGYQQCNTSSCACECGQTASCAVGYKFQNGGGVCGCVCDTASLGCSPRHTPNAASCSCVCQPDCGGCANGEVCNPSTCSCSGGVN